jgi:hypothetical protein
MNKSLFSYIIALHWISNYGITLRLFKKLNSHYQYNLALKLSIYTCLVKAAIKDGNLEFLRQIHRYFEEKQTWDTEEKNKINYSHYQELALTICLELRNHREYRDEMMSFYATSRLGRSLFYESNLDFDSLVLYSADYYKFYLENSSEPGSEIYANFMDFMRGFLSGNDSICHSVYEMNSQVDRAGFKDPVTAGLSDAVNIIYQSCIRKYARLLTVEEIIQLSGSFFAAAGQDGVRVPVYEFAVLFSLNYTDRFQDIIKLTRHIRCNYDLSGLNTSGFYQYYLLCYAQALLHTGHTKEALQLYRRYESTEVLPLMKYYMLIMKYFIDIDFLLYEGNRSGALVLIENIRNISRALQFKYSFARADKLRNQLHHSQEKMAPT